MTLRPGGQARAVTRSRFLGSQAVARAKELGSNPTNFDLQHQQQLSGADTTKTRESLTYLAQTASRLDHRAVRPGRPGHGAARR